MNLSSVGIKLFASAAVMIAAQSQVQAQGVSVRVGRANVAVARPFGVARVNVGVANAFAFNRGFVGSPFVSRNAFAVPRFQNQFFRSPFYGNYNRASAAFFYPQRLAYVVAPSVAIVQSYAQQAFAPCGYAAASTVQYQEPVCAGVQSVPQYGVQAPQVVQAPVAAYAPSYAPAYSGCATAAAVQFAPSYQTYQTLAAPSYSYGGVLAGPVYGFNVGFRSPYFVRGVHVGNGVYVGHH